MLLDITLIKGGPALGPRPGVSAASSLFCEVEHHLPGRIQISREISILPIMPGPKEACADAPRGLRPFRSSFYWSLQGVETGTHGRAS